MPECKTTCKYPKLCSSFRIAEDHVAPDGKIREIVGCTTEGFIFGDEMTEDTIALLREELK